MILKRPSPSGRGPPGTDYSNPIVRVLTAKYGTFLPRSLGCKAAHAARSESAALIEFEMASIYILGERLRPTTGSMVQSASDPSQALFSGGQIARQELPRPAGTSMRTDCVLRRGSPSPMGRSTEVSNINRFYVLRPTHTPSPRSCDAPAENPISTLLEAWSESQAWDAATCWHGLDPMSHSGTGFETRAVFHICPKPSPGNLSFWAAPHYRIMSC
jgi:hypothetical protein